MTRFYHNFLLQHRQSSVSFLNNYFAAFLAGLLLLAASCEEDPTKMGRNLLPSGDFVSIASTDTFNVKTWTMYDNAVRSENPSVSYLGQLFDPYFGMTSAGFVTQIRLNTEWDDEFFEIDSVRLYLRLLSVTGNTTEPHYIRLSEISEQIYKDTAYYSNKDVSLTGYSVVCELPDTLKADTVNFVTIVVPNEFGEYLTRDTAKLFHSDKDPDFFSFFKGIYFQMEPSTDPLFLSLSVAQTSSSSYKYNYLGLFMTDASGNSKEFYFNLDATVRKAAFNTFKHDFDAADPAKKIAHINDTTFLDTLSYVQTLNGAYTRISIPGLKAIKNDPDMKGIAVNKARLIMPVAFDGNIYTGSTIPSQLLLRFLTNTGDKYSVPDYNPYNTAFFDGTPDTTKAVYNFNIATFLQGYLEDKTGNIKPELELFMSPGSPYNVILKANKSHFPVKFELTYTKF